MEIDKQKIVDDIKWDGLKGFVTNTKLSNEEIIANYAHLWNIEIFQSGKERIRSQTNLSSFGKENTGTHLHCFCVL